MYRGRFAPSPTGPLHFGSLVAAVASFLDARAAGGEWLVRMEDLDTPRCVPGAADSILRTLEACGLEWDGEVSWQSERLDLYRAVLDRLRGEGRAYPCACTRKELADSAAGRTKSGETAYPGACRNGLPPGRAPRAWRFLVPSGTVDFDDRVQGPQLSNVETETGDFVLLRADGIFAYQLAVVVDDAGQGITDVVRGADLLGSTARQIALQQALAYRTPRYLHVPVAANAAGEKLSKQTRAPEAGVNDLPAVLRFLGFSPPDLRGGELLRWAVAEWNAARVPAVFSVTV
ncbi:MAG: tRNA glutamyl-Q(34) synthetase GluQRS [Bryobacteraceae bacterium]|nr:tRNA glutamyl-Q(34) synthetase GluQRS [Bryobacteraceae bacterium]